MGRLSCYCHNHCDMWEKSSIAIPSWHEYVATVWLYETSVCRAAAYVLLSCEILKILKTWPFRCSPSWNIPCCVNSVLERTWMCLSTCSKISFGTDMFTSLRRCHMNIRKKQFFSSKSYFLSFECLWQARPCWLCMWEERKRKGRGWFIPWIKHEL